MSIDAMLPALDEIVGELTPDNASHAPWVLTFFVLGMGLGFTLALFILGAVREIFGSGELLGFSLFGAGYQPVLLMILPPGGFFVLGAWLLIFAWFRQRREQTRARQAETAYER